MKERSNAADNEPKKDVNHSVEKRTVCQAM